MITECSYLILDWSYTKGGVGGRTATSNIIGSTEKNQKMVKKKKSTLNLLRLITVLRPQKKISYSYEINY